MTKRPRSVDRRLPVDRTPDRPATPRTHTAGHRDGWVAAIPHPDEADRAAARAYLNRRGHADLIDMLGLAS